MRRRLTELSLPELITLARDANLLQEASWTPRSATLFLYGETHAVQLSHTSASAMLRAMLRAHYRNNLAFLPPDWLEL